MEIGHLQNKLHLHLISYASIISVAKLICWIPSLVFLDPEFCVSFAVSALKLANNIGESKAISQNLMHANISITDGIYGGLLIKISKNKYLH